MMRSLVKRWILSAICGILYNVIASHSRPKRGYLLDSALEIFQAEPFSYA